MAISQKLVYQLAFSAVSLVVILFEVGLSDSALYVCFTDNPIS